MNHNSTKILASSATPQQASQEKTWFIEIENRSGLLPFVKVSGPAVETSPRHG